MREFSTAFSFNLDLFKFVGDLHDRSVVNVLFRKLRDHFRNHLEVGLRGLSHSRKSGIPLSVVKRRRVEHRGLAKIFHLVVKVAVFLEVVVRARLREVSP